MTKFLSEEDPPLREAESFNCRKEYSEPLRQGLRNSLITIGSRCTDCPKCREECTFLKKYGTPRTIAKNYNPLEINRLMLSYECNLCGLCGAVCPMGLKPEEMFLEMRREAVDRGAAPLAEHKRLLAYERRGTSRLFSYYMLPENCRSVFFPGCTLSGTRSGQVVAIYNHLKSFDPSLGIVLDCCCKPSHDLGRMDYFSAMNKEMKSFLMDHGVQKIITACPNCHKIFQCYGEPFEAITIYESLVQYGLPESGTLNENVFVSVHDSCVVRSDASIHDAVRKLAHEKEFTCVDMLHSRSKTLCCGEGGNVESIAPDLAGIWTKKRCDEADGRILLTYCAGCANKLSQKTLVFHILDTVLNPQSVLSGKVKVSKAPWTYLNRLRMKRLLKKQNPCGLTRERIYVADSTHRGKGWLQLIVLLAIAALIGLLHVAGGSRFLDQTVLQSWVESWGVFGPTLYVLIYTAAPVLFLPGLPITIAGGILFGPVWGLVYTIIGATAGACAAFLVARYAARDWIKVRLKSPKWKMLDDGVARHGWKIVALTRLIPIFPFNLLNYAFGLTSIPFFHYAVVSFVCMLPACIAFIVFSSSLLDLFTGQVSAKFIAGVALIFTVMLMPLIYRKFRVKK